MGIDSFSVCNAKRKYDDSGGNFSYVQNNQITSSHSSFQYNNSYTTKQVTHDDNMESLNFCKVCNDKATGIHYGVATCEGCKVYFEISFEFFLFF
jgi:hypothetical protein